MLAAIFDESKKRRRIVNIRVKCKHTFAHARFVMFEQVNGARAVVTAAAARNAIGAREIGWGKEWVEWHRAISHRTTHGRPATQGRSMLRPCAIPW